MMRCAKTVCRRSATEPELAKFHYVSLLSRCRQEDILEKIAVHQKGTSQEYPENFTCRNNDMGVNPKIGVGPQNGWFIMENPIRNG